MIHVVGNCYWYYEISMVSTQNRRIRQRSQASGGSDTPIPSGGSMMTFGVQRCSNLMHRLESVFQLPSRFCRSSVFDHFISPFPFFILHISDITRILSSLSKHTWSPKSVFWDTIVLGKCFVCNIHISFLIILSRRRILIIQSSLEDLFEP